VKESLTRRADPGERQPGEGEGDPGARRAEGPEPLTRKKILAVAIRKGTGRRLRFGRKKKKKKTP